MPHFVGMEIDLGAPCPGLDCLDRRDGDAVLQVVKIEDLERVLLGLGDVMVFSQSYVKGPQDVDVTLLGTYNAPRRFFT